MQAQGIDILYDGPWKVIGGSGTYESVTGSGRLSGVAEEGDGRATHLVVHGTVRHLEVIAASGRCDEASTTGTATTRTYSFETRRRLQIPIATGSPKTLASLVMNQGTTFWPPRVEAPDVAAGSPRASTDRAATPEDLQIWSEC